MSCYILLFLKFPGIFFEIDCRLIFQQNDRSIPHRSALTELPSYCCDILP